MLPYVIFVAFNVVASVAIYYIIYKQDKMVEGLVLEKDRLQEALDKSDIASIKILVEKLNKEVIAGQQKLEKNEKETQDLYHDFQKKQEELTAIRLEKENLQNEMTQNIKEQQHQENEMARLNSQLIKGESDIRVLKDTKVTSEITLQKKEEEFQTLVLDSEKNAVKFQEEINGNREEIESQNKQIQGLKATLEEYHHEKQELDQEVRDVRLQIEKDKDDISEISDNQEKEISQSKKEVDVAREELNTLKGRLADSVELITGKDLELLTLHKKMVELKVNENKCQEILGDRHLETEEEKQELKELIQEKEKTYGEVQDKLKEMNLKLLNIKNQLNEDLRDVKVKDEELNHLLEVWGSLKDTKNKIVAEIAYENISSQDSSEQIENIVHAKLLALKETQDQLQKVKAELSVLSVQLTEKSSQGVDSDSEEQSACFLKTIGEQEIFIKEVKACIDQSKEKMQLINNKTSENLELMAKMSL